MHRRSILVGLSVLGVVGVVPPLVSPAAAGPSGPAGTRQPASITPASFLPGDSSTCDPILDWQFTLLGLLDLVGLDPLDIEIPEPGWVLVDPTNRYREVTGRVLTSDGSAPGLNQVSHTDFPAVHDSHDQDTKIYLDPGQESLLSDVNAPNDAEDVGSSDDLQPPTSMGVEWEIGTFPGETSGDAPERTFPRWAWPSPGDRVWVDGNWIFDCGHPKKVADVMHYKSEIHPPRAIASMRDQMATLPGSGTTPVRVTSTDLYVHGRSGLVGDVLDCGAAMTFGGGDCGPSDYPRRGSPIDVDFDFNVCLPPKPAPSATLSVDVRHKPGSTVNATLQYDVVEADGICSGQSSSPVMLHVVAPLAGTGATPDDVYARQVVAGWLSPDAGLTHVRSILTRMFLDDDTESRFWGGVSGGDCECSFFWVNTNRAATEWYRLAGWDIPTDDDATWPCPTHYNRLTDFDDDDLCGNGNLNFSGPTFDYYLGSGMDSLVSANGYDQDCQDWRFGDTPLLGFTDPLGVPYPTGAAWNIAFCYTFDATEWGNNDDYPDAAATMNAADLASPFELNAGMYDMYFDSELLPLTNENTADLDVSKTCTPDGEVALIGQAVDCTITVHNPGPGLPGGVTVTDTLTGALTGSDVTSTTPSYVVHGPLGDSEAQACTTGADTFSCMLGSVPVGRTATISWSATPLAAGTLADQATVTTTSTDPDASNDSATSSLDVYQPVTVDVRPGETPNIVKLTPDTVISVAVLTTPDLDASRVDAATVCFGSESRPGLRDCTEKHGRGHLVDIDKDRDLDLVLHYEAMQTGIAAGDDRACLIGRTFDGTGVFGCDTILVR